MDCTYYLLWKLDMQGVWQQESHQPLLQMTLPLITERMKWAAQSTSQDILLSGVHICTSLYGLVSGNSRRSLPHRILISEYLTAEGRPCFLWSSSLSVILLQLNATYFFGFIVINIKSYPQECHICSVDPYHANSISNLDTGNLQTFIQLLENSCASRSYYTIAISYQSCLGQK